MVLAEGLGKPCLALIGFMVDRAVHQRVHAGFASAVIVALRARHQALAEFGTLLLGKLFKAGAAFHGGAAGQRQIAALA